MLPSLKSNDIVAMLEITLSDQGNPMIMLYSVGNSMIMLYCWKSKDHIALLEIQCTLPNGPNGAPC
jgi:hypothetical protein